MHSAQMTPGTWVRVYRRGWHFARLRRIGRKWAMVEIPRLKIVQKQLRKVFIRRKVSVSDLAEV